MNNKNNVQGVLFLKYIEIGIGNKWIVRTETELIDGTEFEEQGIVRPIKLYSVYIRIWIRKTIWIFDFREGLKITKKDRNKFKFIIGMSSY